MNFSRRSVGLVIVTGGPHGYSGIVTEGVAGWTQVYQEHTSV